MCLNASNSALQLDTGSQEAARLSTYGHAAGAVHRVVLDQISRRLGAAQELVHMHLEAGPGWSGTQRAQEPLASHLRRPCVAVRARRWQCRRLVVPGAHHFDLRHVEGIAEGETPDAPKAVDSNLDHASSLWIAGLAAAHTPAWRCGGAGGVRWGSVRLSLTACALRGATGKRVRCVGLQPN